MSFPYDADAADLNVPDAEDDPGDDLPTAEQLERVGELVAERDRIASIADPAERMAAARVYHQNLGT